MGTYKMSNEEQSKAEPDNIKYTICAFEKFLADTENRLSIELSFYTDLGTKACIAMIITTYVATSLFSTLPYSNMFASMQEHPIDILYVILLVLGMGSIIAGIVKEALCAKTHTILLPDMKLERDKMSFYMTPTEYLDFINWCCSNREEAISEAKKLNDKKVRNMKQGILFSAIGSILVLAVYVLIRTGA